WTGRSVAWPRSSSGDSTDGSACSCSSRFFSARHAWRCRSAGCGKPSESALATLVSTFPDHARMNPQRSALVALLKLSDLGVVAATFVVALAAATPGEDNWVTILEMRVAVGNLIFMVGYLGFCHLVLGSFGLYRSYRLSPNSREWRDLGAAVLVSTIPVWVLAALLRFEFVTPIFLAAFTALAFCCL